MGPLLVKLLGGLTLWPVRYRHCRRRRPRQQVVKHSHFTIDDPSRYHHLGQAL
jgi:hypothetical protein